MESAISVVHEQSQVVLEKLRNTLELENVRRKDIVVAICVVFGIYVGWSFMAKCFKAHRIRKMLQKVPNKPSVFTGNLTDFPGPGPKIFGWVQNKVKECKTFYQFWIGPFQPMVSLCHPDTAKVLLKSSEPKLINSGGHYSLLQEWLGDGLLLSSGPKWSRKRRLLTPAFHLAVLKPFLNVYKDATDKFLKKMVTLGEDGQKVVPIYKHVSLMTLEIMTRCAFSYGEGTQEKGTDDPYVASVIKLTETLVKRVFSPLLRLDLIWRLSSTGKENARSLSYVHKVSLGVIEQRKKELAENPGVPQKRYVDFMDILLAARDEEGQAMSTNEILHEIDTFLFAGHEDTASCVSFSLYLLAKHPEAQERARQEINDVTGGDRDLEWSELSQLPYLTQCIKEAMRVHPPVSFIGRQLSQDVVIHGVTIPKYTNVEINIYGIHHNPDVWGEDHKEYKPERFHPDNMKNIDSFDFIPFSAGPRNCIGQTFALNGIKVAISKILQTFEIHADPHHEVLSHPETVTRPTNDIKLYFIPLH